MAKKNAIVKRTPEMLEAARTRMTTIDTEINHHLELASKGYLCIAPLIAEVYYNEYYIALGYKNIDDYAKAEHDMSHGTVTGLRQVFDRFGSVIEKEDGSKVYMIPEKYTDWGYTKLYNINLAKKDFEDAGINPFEVFTPDMTLKEMKAALALKLSEKADKQDANAIDTTATDSNSDNKSAGSKAPESQTADEVQYEATFKTYLTELNNAIEAMREYLKNDINEVKICADTIRGQIKTLEKCYAKAHATTTVKDNKKK